MKKKDVSLFELWDKSSKARKITSTSTPTPLSVEIESNLQLALVQTHDEAPQPERERGSPTLIVEDDEAVDEDDESMPQFEAYHHFINQKIPLYRKTCKNGQKYIHLVSGRALLY